jgi:hypothetical protein
MSFVAEDRIILDGRSGVIVGWTDGAELPVIFDDAPWTIVYVTLDILPESV